MKESTSILMTKGAKKCNYMFSQHKFYFFFKELMGIFCKIRTGVRWFHIYRNICKCNFNLYLYLLLINILRMKIVNTLKLMRYNYIYCYKLKRTNCKCVPILKNIEHLRKFEKKEWYWLLEECREKNLVKQ